MLRFALIVLHLFIGISAVGAGQALALQPDGAALGFPVEWLEGSPFPDYRFPGAFLAVVVGGANLVSALALAKQTMIGPTLSLATGALLLLWIAIQTWIIGFVHWTQLFWAVFFAMMTLFAGIRARSDRTVQMLIDKGQQVAHSLWAGYLLSVAVLATLLAVYLVALHPWLMNWGATTQERWMMLPGDDSTLRPDEYFTRAISINASPAEVWPWLLQVGQDRAGFYSNTWLENLFAGDIHNGNDVRPDWQRRAVGDKVPMAGAEAEALLGDYTKLTVRILEPELVIGDIPGRFVLLGQSDGTMRLLVREPLDIPERTGVLGPLLWDPMHFAMEQRMLRGIKERAEGQPLIPMPVQMLARLGWAMAALGLVAYFVTRKPWLPWLIAPAAVFVPTVALTGDYDAAVAGSLAVGITVLGGLAFGRRWWPSFLLLAATVLLVLLLAPDAHSAFGLLFVAGTACGFAGLVPRWLRPTISQRALSPSNR
jgi:hypothetical protein